MSKHSRELEVWLRGPLEDGTPVLVQPLAQALLQARDEVHTFLADFPEEKLWVKPLGLASVGFHLQHLRGVLDRLYTYARGEMLSEAQLAELREEGQETAGLAELLANFDLQVDKSLAALREVEASRLTEAREVGRARLPSTYMGLLVHAAEHTTRHTGQLLVTARVVAAGAA